MIEIYCNNFTDKCYLCIPDYVLSSNYDKIGKYNTEHTNLTAPINVSNYQKYIIDIDSYEYADEYAEYGYKNLMFVEFRNNLISESDDWATFQHIPFSMSVYASDFSDNGCFIQNVYIDNFGITVSLINQYNNKQLWYQSNDDSIANGGANIRFCKVLFGVSDKKDEITDNSILVEFGVCVSFY